MDNRGPGTWNRRETAGSLPFFGVIVAGAALLLAALAVAERAGLPGNTSWSAGVIVLAVAIVLCVIATRNGQEQLFLGRIVLLTPGRAGLALGMLAGAAAFHLLMPASSRAMMSVLAGGTCGLVAAHLLARKRRGSTFLVGEAGAGADGAPSLIQGLILAGAGGLLALSALPAAHAVTMRLTGLGGAASLVVALVWPAVALAIGGIRGLLALTAGLAALIAAGLLASLGMGILQLGTLPLPGFSQTDTLMAIAGARAQLFPADSLPFIVAFIPSEGLGSIFLSVDFLAAFAISALMGRAFSPGVSLAKGRTAAAAVGGFILLLLGLAAMAGYAVEAAGFQFVGASLQTPPPGLLEASRQGIASFCGTRPETLDALRSACGLAPRAQGQLALGQIALADSFLWAGVPVALGLPAAAAAPARLGALAFAGLGVVSGLWLMTLGLGRGVLGRGRIAPGLASQRLGLLRLATMASAGGLGLIVLLGVAPTPLWPAAAVLALLALGLDVVQQGTSVPAGLPDADTPVVQRAATSRKSAAPRKTAQSA